MPHTLDRRALGCIGPPTDKDAVGGIREFACEGGKRVIVEFKREPGTSPLWILQHVRARNDTVITEIEGAGVRLIEDRDLMKKIYFLRFQKADPKK